MQNQKAEDILKKISAADLIGYEDEIKVCPKCGRKMIKKINHWTGQDFYGHDPILNCRYTISIKD